jgi:hypothetical protein
MTYRGGCGWSWALDRGPLGKPAAANDITMYAE